MQRTRLADLYSPPSPLFLHWDTFLAPEQEEWIQPPDFWTMIVYMHSGVAHIDVHPFAYESGDCLVFPPQCRAGHSVIGEDHPHYRIQFGLKGGGERRAVPLRSRLDGVLTDGLARAYGSLSNVDRHPQAFVWYLLWHISLPEAAYRSRTELYEAEEWIAAHLSDPFQVKDLAEAVGVSERTLQRLFRSEHQSSVAQFVRDRRVREAVRLLTQTRLPVKQVGARVGIPNSQGFYGFLRDAIGIGPTEVRIRTGSRP
ncbi:MAG: helix-turn-helix transcriptional regulator [Armatimonadetes bacterium]|nr:helix-turn-helix transcriptional regulator [Armatimonadota bacterium]